MKKNLLFLPFIAIFFAALALALGSAFKDKAWLEIAAWGISAMSLLAWVTLEQTALKRLIGRKGTKYGATSGLSIVLVIAVIVGAGILTTKPRFNKSYDTTRTGLNTLSDQSKKVIATMKQNQIEPELIAVFQEEQQQTKFKDLLALYTSSGLAVKATWIDPQREPTKAMAEKITQANTVILRRGDQESRITTFTEEKITNALISLTKAHTKKIYFTKGHGEGGIQNAESDGLSRLREELGNNKFAVEELSLVEINEVPADADLLVLAGPHYDLRSEEISVLSNFANKGKPLLIMVDAVVQVPRLNAFMAEYGLRFSDNLIIIRPDDPRAQLLGQNNAIVTEFEALHPLTKDFASQASVAIVMGSTRSIEELSENKKSMKTSLVAKTSDANVAIQGVKTETDLKNITAERVSAGKFGVIGVAIGRVGGTELAKNDPAAATGKSDFNNTQPDSIAKELRLVAFGSSKIVSNQGVEQGAANLDMFLNATNYLLQDDDFIAIRPKDPVKSTLDLSSPGSQLTLIFISYIYPFIFLGLGTLAWFRRRSA